jgi:hypothetical protein
VRALAMLLAASQGIAWSKAGERGSWTRGAGGG